MNYGSPPAKMTYIFASSGTKNTVPPTTSGISAPNQAAYSTGFPSSTFLPVPSGGLPPFGADFNGILFSVTGTLTYLSGGGFYTYDSAYATANSGYAQGALILKSNGLGYWQNLTDGNTTNPDAGGTGWADPFINATINPAIDPAYGNSSTSPASTSWVRGAMQAIFSAAGFAVSLGQNGYLKLPSFLGGVVIQWGSNNTPVNAGAIINFPIAFPNRAAAVCLTDIGNGSHTVGYNAISTTSITVTMSASGTQIAYIAIGY